jgi:hypothetical protein
MKGTPSGWGHHELPAKIWQVGDSNEWNSVRLETSSFMRYALRQFELHGAVRG